MVRKNVWIIEVKAGNVIDRYQSNYSAGMSEADVIKEEEVNRLEEIFPSNGIAWEQVTLFADSGAFSAWTQDEVIDIVEYAEWLHQWKHLFEVYVNLDVKTSWKDGLKNLLYLENAGLQPIPVFHMGEPWELLEDLCSQYPYIGLGGMAESASHRHKLYRNLVRCFRIAEGRTVYHGFGLSRLNLLKMLPWYSVDSSSWAIGQRFGIVPVFDPKIGDYHRIKLKSEQWFDPYIGKLITDMGLTIEPFVDMDKYEYTKAALVGALSHVAAQEWLSNYREPIALPDRLRGYAAAMEICNEIL